MLGLVVVALGRGGSPLLVNAWDLDCCCLQSARYVLSLFSSRPDPTLVNLVLSVITPHCAQTQHLSNKCWVLLSLAVKTCPSQTQHLSNWHWVLLLSSCPAPTLVVSRQTRPQCQHLLSLFFVQCQHLLLGLGNTVGSRCCHQRQHLLSGLGCQGPFLVDASSIGTWLVVVCVIRQRLTSSSHSDPTLLNLALGLVVATPNTNTCCLCHAQCQHLLSGQYVVLVMPSANTDLAVVACHAQRQHLLLGLGRQDSLSLCLAQRQHLLSGHAQTQHLLLSAIGCMSGPAPTLVVVCAICHHTQTQQLSTWHWVL